MKSNIVFRIRFLYSMIVVFATILAIKLFFVQIVSGDSFKARADRQYSAPAGGIYDRGSIYFSSKEGNTVGAATLKSGFTLAIDPQILKNPELVYEKLNAIVPIDRQTFLAKTAKQNDPYEEITKRVSEEAGAQIQALKITGVNLYNERWRVYPGNNLAAHVLGFLGYQGNDYAGRYGLERQYESTLKRDGGGLYVNFFAQIFSDIGNFNNSDVTRGDIITTIEPTVEGTLEDELLKVNQTWNSDYSGGIIIDPQTGEIYAMALAPTFNPNTFQKEKTNEIFTNKLVESVYEMGSIIKPLTMAAGIDSGAITATTTYYDYGFVTLNKSTIWNYDHKGRGQISMQEVLNQSLNTGATFAMLQTGQTVFSQYFKSFGLGTKTGIDLPNETSGLIKNLDSPRDIEHATASFGQGIAMTPIETARALSILANGGTLITPRLTKEIDYKSGLVKKVYFDEGPRVIKKATAEAVTKMLVTVVDKALRGGTVKIPNYSVAAKTGTAEIAKPGGGGYYENEYLHSFFGYFPAYNPKFLIFLYTYYPKGVKYASETLTTTFIDLTKFLISFYQIPPDR